MKSILIAVAAVVLFASCGQSAEEKAAMEQRAKDSIAAEASAKKAALEAAAAVAMSDSMAVSADSAISATVDTVAAAPKSETPKKDVKGGKK